MKKLSLKNVKGKLSKKEMRAITGGYGGHNAGFWTDQAYGAVFNWVAGVMWADYRSRTGAPYSASQRYANMGPY